MNEPDERSPLGAEMVAGLSEFLDALEAGKPIEEHFTVRTVRFAIEPRRYQAADIQGFRKDFVASQMLLAEFLGVSLKTIRAWERGTKPIPKIACRFLDEIVADPELWKRRIRQKLVARAESET